MQLCAFTIALAAASDQQRRLLLLPPPIFSRLPNPAVFGLGIMAGILAIAGARGWLRWRRPMQPARPMRTRQQAGLPASAPVAVPPVQRPPVPGPPVQRPPAPGLGLEPATGAPEPRRPADPLAGTQITTGLLADLEKLKIALADGPPDLVQSLVRRAAAELEAGAIGPCELVLVGFGGVSQESATHCERVTAALDLIAARAVATRRRFAESGPAEPSAAIVVSRIPATAAELAMLADLVSEPGRTAALLPAGRSAGRPGRQADRAAIFRLDYSEAAPGVVTTLYPAREAAEAGGADRPEAPAALRIGVLGQLTINGQPGALLPAQTQLLVALALHGRTGLLNRQLGALLGADSEHPKPADSLRQLIARTRRQLGPADDGQEWIVHQGHGRYGLHENSRLDLTEFETLTDEGIAARDASRLAAALAMIRGQPFTGCYYWWLDIELVDTVGARILAASSLLAELALAGADPAAAGRAARIGLVADGTAEQLWRLLMRAEHAAGNLAGVREAWSRCLEAVADIAADGQPAQETTSLYRQLVDR